MAKSPRGSLSTWRRVKGGRSKRGLALLHVFRADKEILAGPNKHTAWPSQHMKYAFGFDTRSHRKFQRSAGGLGQTGEETSEPKPKTSPKAVSSGAGQEEWKKIRPGYETLKNLSFTPKYMWKNRMALLIKNNTKEILLKCRLEKCRNGDYPGEKRLKFQMNNSLFLVPRVKISSDRAGSHLTGCQQKEI